MKLIKERQIILPDLTLKNILMIIPKRLRKLLSITG